MRYTLYAIAFAVLIAVSVICLRHHVPFGSAHGRSGPPAHQRAFLYIVPVSGRPALSVLDEHLVNGWRVVHSTPLGGSDGVNFMALLILERDVPPGADEDWPSEKKEGRPVF